MITIKKKNEIKIMRQGGKILAGILEKLIAEVKPGITTGHLEEMVCSLIKEAGGRPSFKGYKSRHDTKPFPTILCTSINNEIVHAPSLPSRELKIGDIIGIDLGMEYPYGNNNNNGYYTDMSKTVAVGRISGEAQKLIKTTRESLALAIKQVKPGNTLNDIGRAIQQFVEPKGFSVVRELVGHGVGYDVHEEPQVPNFEIKNGSMRNITLKPGMVIAIEPMVNMGGWKVKVGKDGLTILTADNSLSAHFEHTVAVTGNGHQILTEL